MRTDYFYYGFDGEGKAYTFAKAEAAKGRSVIMFEGEDLDEEDYDIAYKVISFPANNVQEFTQALKNFVKSDWDDTNIYNPSLYTYTAINGKQLDFWDILDYWYFFNIGYNPNDEEDMAILETQVLHAFETI